MSANLTSRNFYKSLEIWRFLWPSKLGSHMEWWNSGMLEYWVWKAEKDLFYKKCCIYILWWCPSGIHFLLSPRKYASITRKSIQLYSFWYSKSTTPIFQNPWFHHSIVPLFQLWAKRTKFWPFLSISTGVPVSITRSTILNSWLINAVIEIGVILILNTR